MKKAIPQRVLFILLYMMAVNMLSACVSNNQANLPKWDFNWNDTNQAQEQPADLQEQSNAVTAPVEGVEGQALAVEEVVETALQIKQQQSPVKVGILLPLSGAQSVLGQAMLQSSQMALFEVAHQGFELLPYDTKGTEAGAFNAASQAKTEGVQLILGPVFASSVRAAKRATNGSIPIVAFSTDWGITNSQTSTIGFLPFDQMERIISFSAQQGLTRLGVIAPQTEYGRILLAAYKDVAAKYNIETIKITTYEPQMADFVSVVRNLSGYDDRMAAAEMIVSERMGAGVNKKSQSFKMSALREKNKLALPYDGVFIAAGGQDAITISNLLSRYDMTPSKVRRIGIGLFDDRALAREDAFKSAWFAAPALKARQDFEARFIGIYGQTPPRLASLAYDATALAAILSQHSLNISPDQPVTFTQSAIKNPNGFSGVDGIFRILSNGTAQRGLAILSYDSEGNIIEVDAAPQTFQ